MLPDGALTAAQAKASWSAASRAVAPYGSSGSYLSSAYLTSRSQFGQFRFRRFSLPGDPEVEVGVQVVQRWTLARSATRHSSRSRRSNARIAALVTVLRVPPALVHEAFDVRASASSPDGLETVDSPIGGRTPGSARAI